MSPPEAQTLRSRARATLPIMAFCFAIGTFLLLSGTFGWSPFDQVVWWVVGVPAELAFAIGFILLGWVIGSGRRAARSWNIP